MYYATIRAMESTAAGGRHRRPPQRLRAYVGAVGAFGDVGNTVYSAYCGVKFGERVSAAPRLEAEAFEELESGILGNHGNREYSGLLFINFVTVTVIVKRICGFLSLG